ncbi:MAG: L-threonine 3-dehydrogenase [Clostridiales bacterium]|nr:L-threonine 3-dehydrogenase [Clostridiales bacterium]
MRAVWKDVAGRGLLVSRAPEPACGDNEVLIKVRKAGICGTDLHIFKWDAWSQNRIKPPLVMGHEFVGEIVGIGKAVQGLSLGQRVSAEGHITCGHCRFCRTAQGHICQTVKIIGVDCAGCFAEYIAMPAVNVWPVPDNIADKYAATFDPLGNAMHTAMAQPIAMKNVLISGAGSIGLFAVPIAKAAGAARVIVSEPDPFKREMAARVGADLVIDPIAAGTKFKEQICDFVGNYGCDVLLEMSGNSAALCQGLDALALGGVASLLGIYPGEVCTPLSELVVFKCLTLIGINGRRMFETWYQSENFLATSAAMIDPIITHQLPLEEIENGMLMMEQGKAIKVLLDL